jgi:hypothetical protein
LTPSITVNADDEPPVFVATIWWFFAAVNALGVPVILPVLVVNVRPEGTAGVMDHDVGAPPLVVGEFVEMMDPFVYVAISIV